MNKVRKDLGLSYDENCLYDSHEISFNSEADLVPSNKKNVLHALAGLPDDLILDRNGHEFLKENGDLLSAVLEPEPFVHLDLQEQDEDWTLEEAKMNKKRNPNKETTGFNRILGDEYVVTPETKQRMGAFYNDSANDLRDD
jgi:hypothetical protein